jgi:hypothetical protein
MSKTIPALRYDWAALDYLRREYGENYMDCLDGTDLKALAALIAAGANQEADEIYADSPPVNLAIAAVSKALSEAFNGPDGLATEGKEPEGKLRRFLSWIMSPFQRSASG